MESAKQMYYWIMWAEVSRIIILKQIRSVNMVLPIWNCSEFCDERDDWTLNIGAGLFLPVLKRRTEKRTKHHDNSLSR
jgi:hypothetical protein